MDPTQCSLGKWPAGEAPAKLAELIPQSVEHVARIKAPHDRLHGSAKVIAGMTNKAEALAYFRQKTVPALSEVRAEFRLPARTLGGEACCLGVRLFGQVSAREHSQRRVWSFYTSYPSGARQNADARHFAAHRTAHRIFTRLRRRQRNNVGTAAGRRVGRSCRHSSRHGSRLDQAVGFFRRTAVRHPHSLLGFFAGRRDVVHQRTDDGSYRALRRF